MNFRAVLRLIGRLTMLLGMVQLLPIAWSLWHGEARTTGALLLSSAVALLGGAAVGFLPTPNRTLFRREGILVVVLGWLVASVLGGLPYLFSGVLTSPVDALFESASGFTTTGATVLPDIEAAGYGLLFWRSLTQWLGGLGIVVVFLALLSGFGPNVRVLYRFEVPGPSTEVLHHRVEETAYALFKLYTAMTLAQTVLLIAVGLSVYDALVTALSTLSTGGFSPYSESVAAFSPVAQVIVIVFMVLAGVNFSLLYGIRLGRWSLWRDRELAVYAVILLVVTCLVTLHLVAQAGMTPGRALLDGSFQVASLMTTTGFATANFDLWPTGTHCLLLFVMLVGGCAGSTAGGIKVVRIYLAFKTILREVKLSFKPNAVIPITIRGQVISDDVARSTTAFLLMFFLLLIIGTVLLALGGADLITASTAALASLGNIGPGLQGVGPENSFAFFSSAEKLLLVLLMWFGRLEILAIAALFTPSFWRR